MSYKQSPQKLRFYKLIQTVFTLAILGLLFLALMLITGHFGFALTFSEYIFGLIIIGIVIYISSL